MELVRYVGERIRDLRKAYGGGAGMSQEELATQVRTTANTISRWETGTYEPRLEDLNNVAKVLQVSILDLFPLEERTGKVEITALLRAAEHLPEEDVKELRRYAEFRRARTIYAGRRGPGRKRKES
jgi:transcriptional regulator with XRE-family HTH domain